MEGVTAASTIAQDDWGDDERWEKACGLEEQTMMVYVVLDAPAHLTGDYLVWLARVVRANAKKLTAPPRRGGGADGRE